MDTYRTSLASYLATHKRMPSYREMMQLFGFKSKNSAFRLVHKLIKEGFLAKDKEGKIIPRALTQTLSVLGTVSAGFASVADNDAEYISLDDYLIRNKEATFMLTVDGDSMIDAGIQPGDMVLVERGKVPREGDIVVAWIDGGFTLKYYSREKGHVVLRPANKKYPLLRPRHDLRIEAVVSAVVRKYH